jgi:prepilin-type N-terminal cleavage/methylation domain-containing protein
MDQIVTSSKLKAEGFTLIETLVSVLILAIVMLALLEAVTFYTQHQMNNMLRDEAVRITQDVLYNLRTQDYAVVNNAGTITGNVCTTSAPNNLGVATPVVKVLRTGASHNFNVCWTVTEDSLRAHKTVTAITSWTILKQTFSHQASIVVSNF